ncbi:MAG: Ig-like domain repeat protein [Ahniella sp.]|nr:Ig-like domain repeat protein [Ahniella sp.]
MRFNAAIAGSGTLDLGTGNFVWITATSAFSGTMVSTLNGRLLLQGANLPSLQLTNVSLHGWGQIGASSNAFMAPASAFEFQNFQGTGTGEVRTAGLAQNQYGFSMEVDGAVAGTSHDIIRVTGTISLGTSTLTVGGNASYQPVVGQQIVLFENDGADGITGTFSGRAEASTFLLNGATWRISYIGGTGNDITITCIESPKIWTGAVNALWATPGNWIGGAPVSGDSLVFPIGAANKINTNNLAAGSIFRNITIQDNGYQLLGNMIVPTGTIIHTPVSGSSELALPISVPAPNILVLSGSASFSGELLVAGSISGNGTIRASGGGLVRVSGNHTFSGSFFPTCTGNCASVFLENASMPSTNFVSSTSISGRGQVGDVVVANGSIYPGNVARVSSNAPISVGILQTRNLNIAAGAAHFDINGATPGTQHGQIATVGTVSLGGNVSLSTRLGDQYRPAIGEVIRIIDNDGSDAVSGTFQGLPQGSAVFIHGAEFTISYVGGTGNDVTLTCTHSRKIWTGVVNTLWSNSGNWLGGIPQNGDSVAFPTRASSNPLSNNDLPADRSIRNIWIGQNTTLTGQTIALQSRLHMFSSAEIALPMDLGNRNLVFVAETGSVVISGNVSGSGSIVQHGQQFTYRNTQAYSGVLDLGPVGNRYGIAFFDNIDASAMRVDNSGRSNGRGRIGHLVSDGALGVGAIGTSSFGVNGAARLHAGNVQFTGGTVHLGLEGVVAGASHDQIRSTGTVSIGGTALTLYLASTHVPAVGQQYVLIDNDGTDAITGTFTGVANGSTVLVAGYQFQVNYAGGTGNDLVVTALNGRAVSSTGVVSNQNPSGTGQSVTLTATVSGAGTTPTGTVVFREGLNALGTGTLVGGVATWSGSFPAVGNYSITAEFPGDAGFGGSVSSALIQQVIPRYTLTYAAGSGGSISGAAAQQVNQGNNGSTVVAMPQAGYRFVQWSDGFAQASRSESNVQANLSVTAQFALLQYAVTPNVPAHGTVSPSGVQIVNHGSSTVFTLSPNGGYRIASATGCGGSLAGNQFTTGAITAACAITVSFNRNPLANSGALNLIEDSAETAGNLSGTDDDTLTFSIQTPPAQGTLSQFDAATGAYRYVPFANANGADAFTFTVSDGVVTSSPATVSISISAVNDAPGIQIDDPGIIHPAATTGVINHPGYVVLSTGPANESAQLIQSVTFMSLMDPDGAIVPGSLTIGTNGQLSYNLTGQGGTVAVEFRVQDNGGTAAGGQNQSAPASFTVFVPFSADLQVSKSNQQDGVLEQEQVLYALVAANAGPDSVSEVRVRDLDPIGLGDLVYACNATQSSVACPVACTGTGLLDCTLALAAGQHVRIDVMATVTALDGATISNSADVAVMSGGVVSLQPGNDTDTDVDIVRTERLFSNGFEPVTRNLTMPAAIQAAEAD